LLAVNLVGRSAVIDFDLGFDRIHGVEVNGTGNLESWGARIQRLGPDQVLVRFFVLPRLDKIISAAFGPPFFCFGFGRV
jgi:hypothetical protein